MSVEVVIPCLLIFLLTPLWIPFYLALTAPWNLDLWPTGYRPLGLDGPPWVLGAGTCRIPRVAYYSRLTYRLYNGSWGHWLVAWGPPSHPRVWHALHLELQELRTTTPARLREWYDSYLEEIRPLLSHPVGWAQDRVSLGDWLDQEMVRLLLGGIGEALHSRQYLYWICICWPELVERSGFLDRLPVSSGPYYGYRDRSEDYYTGVDDIPGQIAYLSRPGSRDGPVEWQRLWYRCCRRHPRYALELAGREEVDPHGDGENGYCLLLEYGHLEVARELVWAHGLDLELALRRCQLPRARELLSTLVYRRPKSARTALQR